MVFLSIGQMDTMRGYIAGIIYGRYVPVKPAEADKNVNVWGMIFHVTCKRLHTPSENLIISQLKIE